MDHGLSSTRSNPNPPANSANVRFRQGVMSGPNAGSCATWEDTTTVGQSRINTGDRISPARFLIDVPGGTGWNVWVSHFMVASSIGTRISGSARPGPRDRRRIWRRDASPGEQTPRARPLAVAVSFVSQLKPMRGGTAAGPAAIRTACDPGSRTSVVAASRLSTSS